MVKISRDLGKKLPGEWQKWMLSKIYERMGR
jgi:hypothetical protein